MTSTRMIWGLAAASCLVALPGTGADATQTVTPSVEQCFLLTDKQSDAYSWPRDLAPVDCAQPHTHQITAVVTVPAKYAKKGYDSPTVNAWSNQACHAALEDRETRPSLSFGSGWYMPTKSEWGSGSREVVCAGVTGELNGRKWKLTTTQGVYDKSKFKPQCYVHNNKTGAWTLAPCSNPKSQRLISKDPLPWPVTASYPGRRALYAKGKALAGKNDWGVSNTRRGWNSGYRYLYIYKK